MNLHPPPRLIGKAVVDIVTHFRWRSFTILYEEPDGWLSPFWFYKFILVFLNWTIFLPISVNPNPISAKPNSVSQRYLSQRARSPGRPEWPIDRTVVTHTTTSSTRHGVAIGHDLPLRDPCAIHHTEGAHARDRGFGCPTNRLSYRGEANVECGGAYKGTGWIE